MAGWKRRGWDVTIVESPAIVEMPPLERVTRLTTTVGAVADTSRVAVMAG